MSCVARRHPSALIPSRGQPLPQTATQRPGRVVTPGRAGGLRMSHPSLGVLAQVSAQPSSTGMPGADLLQQLINWLAQIALWGSLSSVLVGAAIYGLAQQSGNYGGGYRGRQLALAGVV